MKGDIKTGFWVGLGVALAFLLFSLVSGLFGRGLGKIAGGGGG